MSAADLLDELDPASRAHSDQVAHALRTHIEAAGGWLSFEQWMDLALYAPGLGYYAAGSTKLADTASVTGAARAGDFVTAPELTPLFAATLAFQVAQVLRDCQTLDVLEFGAGTGALARGLIDALDAQGLAVRYVIVEVSADLRERQQQTLARHAGRVTWLDTLPTAFSGCIVANEVLDAMPVRLFTWSPEDAPLERGVTVDANGTFTWDTRPADAELAALATARMPALPGYETELNPRAEAFIRSLGDWLVAGAALFIDYGFPRHEYYHPQRAGGTLMCHLRHLAHADPLIAPGVQDITAHIDFTAMADAALDANLEVLGYTSQARFLMNAGLAHVLQTLDPSDTIAYTRAIGPVQKLISEAEMGELFKVLAIGRGLSQPLIGFLQGDRRHRL